MAEVERVDVRSVQGSSSARGWVLALAVGTLGSTGCSGAVVIDDRDGGAGGVIVAGGGVAGAPQGGRGAAGSTAEGGGGGGRAECSAPADCPATGNSCIARTCVSGGCGTEPAPAGTSCSGGGSCDGAGVCTGQIGGAHLWSKRFGDAEWQLAQSVAVDASDNVVVAGHSTGAIDLGGGALLSEGYHDPFWPS